ncbi:MAG: hypothetical protein CMJ83_04410 [Planctomycetes bacterium]|nr:hypothetical protein [Planctomycetota bacterium]
MSGSTGARVVRTVMICVAALTAPAQDNGWSNGAWIFAPRTLEQAYALTPEQAESPAPPKERLAADRTPLRPYAFGGLTTGTTSRRAHPGSILVAYANPGRQIIRWEGDPGVGSLRVRVWNGASWDDYLPTRRLRVFEVAFEVPRRLPRTYLIVTATHHGVVCTRRLRTAAFPTRDQILRAGVGRADVVAWIPRGRPACDQGERSRGLACLKGFASRREVVDILRRCDTAFHGPRWLFLARQGIGYRLLFSLGKGRHALATSEGSLRVPFSVEALEMARPEATQALGSDRILTCALRVQHTGAAAPGWAIVQAIVDKQMGRGWTLTTHNHPRHPLRPRIMFEVTTGGRTFALAPRPPRGTDVRKLEDTFPHPHLPFWYEIIEGPEAGMAQLALRSLVRPFRATVRAIYHESGHPLPKKHLLNGIANRIPWDTPARQHAALIKAWTADEPNLVFLLGRDLRNYRRKLTKSRTVSVVLP